MFLRAVNKTIRIIFTGPSLQTGGFGAQPPADGGGLQPVEGAGSQTGQNQRRRIRRNAVVLNGNTEEDEEDMMKAK